MNIPFVTKYIKRKKAEKEVRTEILWKIYERITDIANDQLCTNSQRVHREKKYYGGKHD